MTSHTDIPSSAAGRGRLFSVLLLGTVIIMISGGTARAQLAVSQALTAEQLVTQIFAGSNAVISNVQYTGAPGAIGSFTANATNLGLEAGIIMTTGTITNAIGPNNDTSRTTENGTPGDDDLRKLQPHDTVVVRDAAVLEFDFYSYADKMTFEYVFASEEYPEFVGSIYNDGFGFFISGPGYVGNENIALIPGTAIPVSINNINHIQNPQFYIDNTNGQTIEYDGFTTVLTAEASVVPCATYHLKLAIGDVADELYDSGVFLKAKSFEAGSGIYIAGKKDAIEGCGIGNVMLVRTGRTNHSITYQYSVSGTAEEGTDFTALSGELSFVPEQDTGYVYIEALDDGIFDPGETVTITLINNCGFVVDSATITIGEAKFFSVQVTGDSTACFGQPIQLQAFLGGGAGGPYSYYWEPSNLIGETMVHVPDSSMYYRVTVTDSSNGCHTVDSFYVNVYYLELEESEDIFLCPGGEGQIGKIARGGKAPIVYSWDPPKGLSSYSEPTPMAYPDETTEYVVTVTDAVGCIVTDTIKVHVSDLAVATPGDDTLCAHGSKRISAIPSGGAGEYKYRWEPALGISDTTAESPMFAPPFTTKYKVWLTDKIGCVAVDSFVLRVNPELIVDAGPDLRICPGSPVILGSGAHGGTPPYTFLWQPPVDLEDPTAERPVMHPQTTRTYRVRVTDAFGCTAEDIVTVRVEPTVIADAGDDTTMCLGASKQLQGMVAGGKPPYTIKWTPTAGISDSLTLRPFVTPDTTTTYYITATDSVGCTFSDSVVITVSELPLINAYASGPTEVCAPDSVVLYSEPGYTRYLWSNGDSTEIAIIRTSGTYGVTAWTAEGCKAYSDSVTVTIHELPGIAIFGPASVCLESRSVFYFKPAPPGYTYSWTVDGGTIKDRINNSITVIWDGTPMSKVSLTVKEPQSGCTMTVEHPVEVATTLRPVVSFDGDPVRCEGDSVMLNAGLGYMGYVWSTGDTTESIVVRTSGTYTVTVTDSSGCSGVSDPVTITFKAIPVPDIVLAGPAVICDGESTTLEAPEGFISYVWSDNDTGRIKTVNVEGDYTVTVTDNVGCVATSNPVTIKAIALPSHAITGPTISCVNVEADYYVDDIPGIDLMWQCTGGVIQSDPTAATITVKWTTEGKGLLTLDVTKDGHTCTSLYEYEVDVVRNFEFDIEISGPTTFCSDKQVVLSAPQGFRNYNWSNGEHTDTIIVKETGAYWVTITDLDGCEGISDTVYTTVFPSPAAVIEPLGPTDLCEGDSVVLRSQFIQTQYRWSTGETTRIIKVTTPGTYVLTVTNDDGCSSTSTPLDVHIADNPEPVINGPTPVCQDGSAFYETPFNPGSAYTWTVTGGSVINGAGTNRVEILWETAGPGTIEVLETTSGGCIGHAATYPVDIQPAPVPVITRTDETLSTENWVTYQWSHNGTPILDANGRSYIMTVPGSYTVTVEDVNGCYGTSDPIVYEPFATSVISLPNIKALPGEKVFIPVVVSASTGFLDDAVDTFDGAILVDASVLFPSGTTPAGTINNGIRRIPISGTKIDGSNTIAVLEFTAMLGNTSSALLEFESFNWDNPAVAVTTELGSVEIDVCREGGERLFQDTGVLQLAQNSPNPFNSSTVIEFHLIERGHTRLTVMDMLGREVAVIIDRMMEPGGYSAYFDANKLASGNYIYVLTTPTAQLQRSMRLMK